MVPQRFLRLGPSFAGYPQCARPALFFVLLLGQPLQGVEAAGAELEIPTKIPGSARSYFRAVTWTGSRHARGVTEPQLTSKAKWEPP